MAACEVNTGIDFWMNIPACELNAWLEALNEHQKKLIDAIKKSRKK